MRWSVKGSNYSYPIYTVISYDFLIDLIKQDRKILEISEGEKQHAVKWVFEYFWSLHNFTVTPK
jgi:hypothetical protein